MLRTFARGANAPRILSATARNSAIRPAAARGFISATSRASVRTQMPNSQRYMFSTRNYSITPGNNNQASEESASETTSETPQAPQDIAWIELLESASKAPWLTSVPPDHQDRFRRSYSLLFHVILYLGRPLTKDVKDAEAATQQFLMAFNSAPVTADSEIGRARYAIGLLTKTITNDITTIPEAAPIRSRHAQVFALAGALVPLCEVHLEGLVQGTAPASGEVVEEGKWQDFWAKAQPIVLALGEELDKEGYGINEELMKEAKAEQERKDREAAAPVGEEKK